jgi:hypothetical protein
MFSFLNETVPPAPRVPELGQAKTQAETIIETMIKIFADLSKRDAIHDFGKIITDFFSNMKINFFFNRGLPTYTHETNKFSFGSDIEKTGWVNVIKSLESASESGSGSALLDFKDLFNKENEDISKIYNLTTKTEIEYTVTHTKAKENGIYITAQKFIENLSIESNSGILVDAVSLSLLTILKTGGEIVTNIYYLFTPEVVNDPAGKTPLDDSIFSKKGGVNFIPCETNADEKMVYSYYWDTTNDSPYSRFFTKYEFQLSELQKLRLGKTVRYSSNLLIKDKDYKFVEKSR